MTLRIVLQSPPAGVDFALQQGKGSQYTLAQRQRSTGRDLVFECEARFTNGDCFGPFVQGPKGQRFVYISIGKSAGQFDSPWTRRLKVPLTGLTADGTWETHVPGTDRKGEPACATVKPFGGWKRL